MNLLDQLPTTDGCLFIDNTIMELIQTCPTAAYYYWMRKREADSSRPPLRFGGHIHKALAYRYTEIYNGNTNMSNIEDCMIGLLTDLFKSDPCETEGWRNLDSACKAIRAYNRAEENHDLPNWSSIVTNPITNKPFIEQTIAVPMGTVRGYPIIFMGQIDLGVLYDDGFFIPDHKTTSVLGDTYWSDVAIAPQFRGYCWACKQAFGSEPIGFVVNALGIRSSITTAQWDPITEKLLPSKGSKAVPVEFARQRFFTKVPTGQLDEWHDNFLVQLDTFLYQLSTNRLPMNRKWCIGKFGKCQYYPIDELPPASRESALQSGAYRDVVWSPLK